MCSQVASLEEKHVKLLEKNKQDEAKLAEMKTAMAKAHSKTVINSSIPLGSSTVLTYANQVPVQSVSAPQNPSFNETLVQSTSISPTVMSTTPAQVSSATENKLPQSKISQEHILKEIQVTLEERKKLQTFVSKYEKGLHDLEKGSLLPNNVRTIMCFSRTNSGRTTAFASLICV